MASRRKPENATEPASESDVEEESEEQEPQPAPPKRGKKSKKGEDKMRAKKPSAKQAQLINEEEQKKASKKKKAAAKAVQEGARKEREDAVAQEEAVHKRAAAAHQAALASALVDNNAVNEPPALPQGAVVAVLKPSAKAPAAALPAAVPKGLKERQWAPPGCMQDLQPISRARAIWNVCRNLMRHSVRRVKESVFKSAIEEHERERSLARNDEDEEAIAEADVKKIAFWFYTTHGNYLKRQRKDLFTTFAIEGVKDSYWLSDLRATTLAARYLLMWYEFEVTSAEKEYVRSTLNEYLSPSEQQTVQAAIDGPR